LFNKDKERNHGTEEVLYRVPDTEVLGILKYIGLGSLPPGLGVRMTFRAKGPVMRGSYGSRELSVMELKTYTYNYNYNRNSYDFVG
jgi:hypothetical protein